MRADVITYYLLTQTTEISDVLTAVFPVVVPQSVSLSTGNTAVYSIVSTDAVTTKTSFNDYDRVTVQISLFSTDLDSISNAADIIRNRFDRYSGTITLNAIDYNVDLIRFVNQEFVGFDEDNEVFMIACDYLISTTNVFINNMDFENWSSRLGQYEDDAAAIAGGVSVGSWYFNTILKTVTQV